VSPLANLTWARLEEDARLLKTQTDQDGTPLTVVRLPLPDEITVTVEPTDGICEHRDSPFHFSIFFLFFFFFFFFFLFFFSAQYNALNVG